MFRNSRRTGIYHFNGAQSFETVGHSCGWFLSKITLIQTCFVTNCVDADQWKNAQTLYWDTSVMQFASWNLNDWIFLSQRLYNASKPNWSANCPYTAPNRQGLFYPNARHYSHNGRHLCDGSRFYRVVESPCSQGNETPVTNLAAWTNVLIGLSFQTLSWMSHALADIWNNFIQFWQPTQRFFKKQPQKTAKCRLNYAQRDGEHQLLLAGRVTKMTDEWRLASVSAAHIKCLSFDMTAVTVDLRCDCSSSDAFTNGDFRTFWDVVQQGKGATPD